MPMQKIDEAIGLLRDGRAAKVVLVPWGGEGVRHAGRRAYGEEA